ncbi:lantibiotic dehydratase [Pontibacter actiniarum]|uniref:Lantibiotic dehydratase n=1 Tax=Pontibacter actiniarum TaxID=323450 RepID=A0A1X9YS70_9BACT|nr:lantibiotic dehydratase [Pontibacter actiniarum]ARS35708.1 hypothetical protein CA264_09795 [Pontibacter actiniarum]
MSKIHHFGRFVMRSPLFSYNSIRHDASLTLDELLEEQLRNDTFLEAIFWASPTLYDKTVKMLEGNEANKDRVISSLKKYLIRASSRCTPFGTFAGCSVGRVTSTKDNVACAAASYTSHKHVRIDMHLLFTLSHHISKDISIWPVLKYYPNNSMYEVGDSYRYVEYEVEKGLRSYRVSSVEKDSLLETIFTAAKSGVSVKEIIDLMDFDEEPAEKERFAYELIASQLLVSELEISVTNPDPLASLTGTLRSIAHSLGGERVREYLRVLNDFQEGIALLRKSSGKPNLDKVVRAFKQGIQELGIPVYNSNFFQVDLFKEAQEQATISEATVNNVLKGVEVVSRFTGSQTIHEQLLEDFKAAFVEKYETEEVPLAEVLDSETGIGFPVLSSIGNVSNITLQAAYKEGRQPGSVVEPWHGYLQGLYEKAVKQELNTIELRDEDIAKFHPKTDQLPASFATMFSFLSSESASPLYLQSVGGTTANCLLGRFGHLDPAIRALSLEVAEKEQELMPDTVLAEVLHLPEARVGNILQRPVLREFEIPYLSEATVGDQCSLPIADLTVSVERDTIVLRSKRLNKQVIPRLSTAHNYGQHSLPVYHFLCAVQHQGKHALKIDWGGWAEGMTFLPRLSYKNIILSPATWRFSEEDVKHILESEDKYEKLAEFCERWKLPPTVAITRADNQLVCHMEKREYQEIFLQEMKVQKSIHLTEWFHFEGNSSPNSFTNQIVLPLYHLPAVGAKAKPKEGGAAAASVFQRSFFPGSVWLYMKIYCGAHVSDRILAETVKRGVDKLVAAGDISQYFFVRYADPHYHVRLRLHLQEREGSFTRALDCLTTALATFTRQRLVWKVQLDTYVREVERYSAALMVLSERIFYHDSALFLAANEQVVLDEEEDSRLLFALQNVAAWLDTFQLDLGEKLTFVQAVAASLGAEFHQELRVELDQKYRSLRKKLLQQESSTILGRLLALRRDRVVNEIKAANFKDEKALQGNLSSYIHMSMNRWFKSDQRLQEYVVYYFLQKFYTEKSKRARTCNHTE